MPTVLSTSMKRPSSSSTFKRPAAKAKTGALNQTVESLKRGWEGEDEDTNTKKTKKKESGDDEESADADGDGDASYGEPRDKGKAVKFAQMRKSLPPHIIQLYDEEAAKKASPRAFRSQIVNTLFRKLSNGRYELRCEAPLFTEAKRIFETKYGKEKEKGYPRSVIRGLYFQNSESALVAAIEAGDVYSIMEGGKEFFAFSSVESGRVRPIVWHEWVVDNLFVEKELLLRVVENCSVITEGVN